MLHSRKTRTLSFNAGEQLERCFGGWHRGALPHEPPPSAARARDTREAKRSLDLPRPAAAAVPEERRGSWGDQEIPKTRGADLKTWSGPALCIHMNM